MISEEMKEYMSNKTEGKCPCCPRGCDLSAPHCGRGEEYAKTGKIPEGGSHDHDHGHGHERGHGRLQFEKREQQLVMKYLHHAVGVADNGGITQENAASLHMPKNMVEFICSPESAEWTI